MSEYQQPNVVLNGGEALKSFQLSTEGIRDKSSEAFGLAVSREIFGYVTSGFGGYFFNRNARFRKNRDYANGRIDVQRMFQDRFQFNAKQNYIALTWRTTQIVNRIISGLVGRWMKRNEKIIITAIDNLSQKQKREEYENIEFIIENRRMLEQLQKESGVQMIPQGELPADSEELQLWQSQLQRLPEEILYEQGCNNVIASNGWFDVLKEKMLHDASEVLLVGTYTWMDDNGIIHVEWVKPENAIYSYTEFPDFRDTSWRGQITSRKISEIRRRWGREFGGKLSEETLWEIAQKSKNYQQYSNISWTDSWYNSFVRPYDEWNIKLIEFELKSVDSESYTVTNTKSTGTTYVNKGLPKTKSGRPKEKSDNQQIIPDTNWNIYRGVYIPDCDLLLEWGLKDNMIRPQDPKEIGNAEFSYSFYAPQIFLMRNMAIPEKIEAAVDGMIFALLKIQQCIARSRPPGAIINEDALQAIDYGLGDANKDIDYKKLFDQTGDLYYKGRDAEGNPIPAPITELANAGFLPQLQGYMEDYRFHYQILKDELGEDPQLMSAALQPRVTGQNVEASQLQAEYATDYIYNAYAECMKITARKVSCLLKDSIDYGSSAYRKIVNKENIKGRIFTTDIKFLPTQYEVMKFEAMMNEAMRSTPELVLFLNPFQLMRIAQEDVKLAELFFRNGQKKMIAHQQQVNMQNQQATFEAQVTSAKVAEEEKRKTKQEEGDVEIKKAQMTAEAQNRTSVLNGIFAMLQKQQETGAPIPAAVVPLVNAVMENVALSAIVSTEEQKNAILQQMQAAQQPPENNMNPNQQPPLAA